MLAGLCEAACQNVSPRHVMTPYKRRACGCNRALGWVTVAGPGSGTGKSMSFNLRRAA
jgi:hypothetical protein